MAFSVGSGLTFGAGLKVELGVGLADALGAADDVTVGKGELFPELLPQPAAASVTPSVAAVATRIREK